MQKINFENKPSTNSPINASNLNLLQDNIDDAINEVHGIGTTYVNDTNPSALFGGTWEQVKTFAGGELLAYGWAYNGSTNNTKMNKDENLTFSNTIIPNKKYSITNYLENILIFDSGTFKINTKNIVGLIEADINFSGSFEGNGGIWWKGNENALPQGISIDTQGTGPLSYGANNTYSTCSKKYFYSIDESVTENLNFYVNPIGTIYNSSFTPCDGGVKCELLVKIYAKKNLTYLWKRTA